MNVLVTGATGFLGSRVIEDVRRAEAIGFDRDINFDAVVQQFVDSQPSGGEQPSGDGPGFLDERS